MKKYKLILLLVLSFIMINKSKAQRLPILPAAKLNHIAVYVSDLEKSAFFYETLLNLVEIEEPFKDGKHVWFTLGPAGQMHLIKGVTKKTEHDKNEHLCFSVNSITDFIAKLDHHRIDYTNWEGTEKAPTVRIDGVKQVYFRDPDGHWLEVNDVH